MLIIDLPADIEARLDALALTEGQSKNDLARNAILNHMDRIEALHDAGDHTPSPGIARLRELWNQAVAQPDASEDPDAVFDALEQKYSIVAEAATR